MPKEDITKENNFFMHILLSMVIISLFLSFYLFYFNKNYDFFIETSCDSSTETCFYRDCENNPDICPPNNLSYYNQFTISAKDFGYCKDEDCTEACTMGTIQCLKTECTEGDIKDGICVIPSSDELDPLIGLENQ